MEHEIRDAPDAVDARPGRDVAATCGSTASPSATRSSALQLAAQAEAEQAEADGPSRAAVDPAVRPGGDRLRGAARPAGRAGRPVRIGQDDDHLPRAAAVRRRRRQRAHRRDRRAADRARVAGTRDRGGHPGDLPVPRIGPREPALRQAGRDHGGDRGRRPRGGDPRSGDGAARGRTTPSSASAATSSPAARSSAWRSPACCSRTRGS